MAINLSLILSNFMYVRTPWLILPTLTENTMTAVFLHLSDIHIKTPNDHILKRGISIDTDFEK